MFITHEPWYELHEYFSYALAIFGLMILIQKTIESSAIYRVKYYPAVIAFVLTMACEGLCAVTNARMDYALFGYVGLAIYLIYHSVYHVFDGLITSTLSLVTADSHSGVVCFDIDGKCIYANDVVYSLYPAAKDLTDFEEPFVALTYANSFENASERKWNQKYETEVGTQYFEISFGKLQDKNNKYIGSYFYLYDRTQDVEEYEEANYRATHDALTELSNREQFIEEVELLIKRNSASDLYVLAADIKDFKLINDLFGFQKGNDILIQFGQIMRSSLAADAVCCRMNSDRFAFCVFRDTFNEVAIRNRLHMLAESIENDQYQLCVHFGVYQVTSEDTDAIVMYDRARMALKTINDDYQKMFAYYDSNIMERVIRQKKLVGQFELALEKEEFEMYLQAQVTAAGDVIGAEALVRWNHPKYGMVAPGEFISAFENAGLIHRLDQYMWECAVKKLKEWKDAGKEQYHISVNISAKDFYYIDVYKTVTDLVQKYGVDPSRLKLEITESAFMIDPDQQLELITRLQKYGFQVEIDDFGSGYSSLNMLMDMKADVLKIDMGFLRKTTENSRTKIILAKVIALAKELEMTVVTEGVETKEQVQDLLELGSDLFQGFYFARPIPVEEFEEKYL